MHPYERFDAWKHSHDLFLAIHRVTATWPKREWYGLSSQIRRSAFSVPANIAEGSAKRGKAEFRRYLDIALGSLSETQYALRAARDLGLLSGETWEELEAKSQQAVKTLWGLARTIS